MGKKKELLDVIRNGEVEFDSSWREKKPTVRQRDALVEAIEASGQDNPTATAMADALLAEHPTRGEIGDLLSEIFAVRNSQFRKQFRQEVDDLLDE